MTLTAHLQKLIGTGDAATCSHILIAQGTCLICGAAATSQTGAIVAALADAYAADAVAAADAAVIALADALAA